MKFMMSYADYSKKELIDEVLRMKSELQEARDMLQAIQRGEIDAVVVQQEDIEKVYVLEDSNITFRKMIEEISEGAVIFNDGCSVLYCNKAFAEMLRYPVSEIVSRPVTSFINPRNLEVFQSFINFTGSEPVKISLRLHDRSGKNIPVMISLHKVEVSGMDVFLMMVGDEREKLYIKKLAVHQKGLEKLANNLKVAKEKAEQAVNLLKEKNLDYTILNEEYININNILAKTNEELLESKQKAERSDRLKSAFIANMSHEIRTPLNSILGYTKMLLDSVDDDQQKSHIEVIIQSGKHLLHLIDDIVDLSRLESGEMKIVESPLSVNNMMNDLKTQFHAYAVNKGKQHIDFRENFSSGKNDAPVVLTDEFRVRQVLNNILSNALKYTEKGYIEFGYEICEPKRELKFFVRDTGHGISKEDQIVIFNRFEQGASPSGDVVSGTGLGLAISKGLTELLGGEIWVESVLGSGSTFYFTIPYKKADPHTMPVVHKNEIADTRIPSLSGKRILLSEDDLFSREMMIYLLKKTDAELFIAEDGRKTLDLFGNNTIDLVLLDLRLPEIDGYNVLKKIRSDKPDTIVIAQTAYAMLDDIRKFKEVGFDDYLLKPVNDEELFSMLNKYLA